jgi:hypothetical protein
MWLIADSYMFLFEKVFSSVMLLIAGWESFRHSDVVCFCLTNVFYIQNKKVS